MTYAVRLDPLTQQFQRLVFLMRCICSQWGFRPDVLRKPGGRGLQHDVRGQLLALIEFDWSNMSMIFFYLVAPMLNS